MKVRTLQRSTSQVGLYFDITICHELSNLTFIEEWEEESPKHFYLVMSKTLQYVATLTTVTVLYTNIQMKQRFEDMLQNIQCCVTLI